MVSISCVNQDIGKSSRVSLGIGCFLYPEALESERGVDMFQEPIVDWLMASDKVEG